jgi:hypothetical protein
VCSLFFVCIVRGIFDGVALVSSKFLEGDGWGMDGWFSLVFIDHFSILLGLFTCLRW